MNGMTVDPPVRSGDESLKRNVRSYLTAGSIASGPWVVSIFAILAIGRLGDSAQSAAMAQFQTIVTCLIASSLISMGPLQLLFARFASDEIYQQRPQSVVPNLLGSLIVTVTGAGVLGAAALPALPGTLTLRICLLASFVTLCAIWLATMFVGAIQASRRILAAFFFGYGGSAAAALALEARSLEGMLVGFLLGQGVLLFILLLPAIAAYDGDVAFDFLAAGRRYPTLLATGLLYPLALWCDKFIFWFDASTGISVFGVLRASPIYDTPIFLAYLSLIPGMTVLQARMDGDTALRCSGFFRAIEQGATLTEIRSNKVALIASMRETLMQIFKVQCITTAALIAFSGELLAWFEISPLHRQLLNVDLLATFVQLFFLAVLNLLTFLDHRKAALILCGSFLSLNAVLTLATLHLGPSYYGYGFALAAAVSVLVGLALLSRKLDRLEYETFMLQQAAV